MTTTTATTRAIPVIERTAGQRAAEQALSDAHARVEAADEAAAAADLTRDGLLERLRAGDETVFSNTLATADAACRRSELLAVAARDALPIAEAKVRDADLSAVVNEARDYLQSGDLKRIREAWTEARRAKDHAEQLAVAHHRVITDLGRRLQAHGAPRQPPDSGVTGWCGRPHPGGPEGSPSPAWGRSPHGTTCCGRTSDGGAGVLTYKSPPGGLETDHAGG